MVYLRSSPLCQRTICCSGHASSFTGSRQNSSSSALHSAVAATAQPHYVTTSGHHLLSPHPPANSLFPLYHAATVNNVRTSFNNFVVRIMKYRSRYMNWTDLKLLNCCSSRTGGANSSVNSSFLIRVLRTKRPSSLQCTRSQSIRSTVRALDNSTESACLGQFSVVHALWTELNSPLLDTIVTFVSFSCFSLSGNVGVSLILYVWPTCMTCFAPSRSKS